jgi:hypothetical protein
MRVVLSLIAGAVAFVVVGVFTARAILHHLVAGGAVAQQVRMGAWAGGLFAGGVCAVLAGIVVALVGKRR